MKGSGGGMMMLDKNWYQGPVSDMQLTPNHDR